MAPPRIFDKYQVLTAVMISIMKKIGTFTFFSGYKSPRGEKKTLLQTLLFSSPCVYGKPLI